MYKVFRLKIAEEYPKDGSFGKTRSLDINDPVYIVYTNNNRIYINLKNSCIGSHYNNSTGNIHKLPGYGRYDYTRGAKILLAESGSISKNLKAMLTGNDYESVKLAIKIFIKLYEIEK